MTEIKQIFSKLDELKFFTRQYKRLKDGSYDLVSVNTEFEDKIEQLKSEVESLIQFKDSKIKKLEKKLSSEAKPPKVSSKNKIDNWFSPEVYEAEIKQLKKRLKDSKNKEG